MTGLRRDATVGPWAREKLDALGQYLRYYTNVLKNQTWCRGTIFVDAFAGPGLSPVRTSASSHGQTSLFQAGGASIDHAVIEYLQGSPRVALEVANPFSRYVFIDSKQQRVRELEALRMEYGTSRNVEIRQGDANAEINNLLEGRLDWRVHRGVVFLDPFGMHVHWTTIERIAKTRAMEVMINFPLGMAIQRLLTKSGEIPQDWQDALDRYFGSPDWREHDYEDTPGLFGAVTRKISGSGLRLLEWYCRRLQDTFGHVSSARLIKNTRGGHLYYLVWAGPHERGLKGANYILRKGAAIGTVHTASAGSRAGFATKTR
jgi:three-Cys-motif partner protein